MIPQDWQEKTLGEVCTIIAGQSPNSQFYNTEAVGLPFYQGKKEFTNKYIGVSTIWTTEVTKEAFAGDILMSVRAPVGPINYATEKCCIGRGLASIRNGKSISKDFLFYYLLSIQQKIGGHDGAVFSSISRNEISSLKIVLPPLPEQERIVAKLDKAFEAIDKAKTIAETNLKNAKELFTSMLDTLCHDKKVNWTQGRLDNYFVLQRGFDLPKQDRKKGQYPLVSSNGITDFINTYKIKRPVVVTGRSGTIGSVHYVDENSWPLNTTLYVKDFKNNVPKYIFYYLKSLNLAEFSSGAGVPTLNRNYIHELIISFPLQNEQQKIVEKLDKLQEQTKQLEAIYIKQIKDLDELKQSILQKAFRGEL
mgnify:CR=1 FL=1